MFLGKRRTDLAFERFSDRNAIEQGTIEADFRVVNFAEKLLSGAVGSASARVLMSSVVKEEEIKLEEVFNILQETQRYITDNKELKKKSAELETAGVKLREANKELTKLDELKDEFISTVTHEMRTPITSIRALSEIINDNEDLKTEERAKFLDTIVEETKRMERLINQVLDLEKMESGKLEIPFSTIHLNDVANESVRKVKQLISEKGIALNTNLHGKLPLVKGNRDRLVQVILNLMSN
ncbi:MAG: HAMP domain-containing sensor histidine kinase, partial [Bacteroidota bacterium]